MNKETKKPYKLGFSKRLNDALAIRDYQNKTYGQIAEIFDVSRTTVHKWMHLDTVPSVMLSEKICKELNINLIWFLTGKGEMLLTNDLTKDETALLLMYRNLKPEGRRLICKSMFTEYAGFEVTPRTKVENQAVLKLLPAIGQD